MSKITLSGNASGTGTLTIAAPNTDTDRTLDLPNAGGTMVLDTATQTLTNKTIQGGALTLATAVASTSGTSIDFTSIPSWVKRITVMFSGVSTNGTSNIQIQLGDNGGFETSGYVGSVWLSNTINTASSIGFLVSATNVASYVWHGAAVITKLQNDLWVIQGTIGLSGGGTASGVQSGNKTLSDTLTQVRITTVNGTDTFDAGTINIMYEG
jgi:hypothetical protein